MPLHRRKTHPKAAFLRKSGEKDGYFFEIKPDFKAKYELSCLISHPLRQIPLKRGEKTPLF